MLPSHYLSTIGQSTCFAPSRLSRANPLARDSTLYVFSDAAVGPQDSEAVETVRRIVKTTDGFKEICVREQPKNLGLAKSIITGVTELAAAYGRSSSSWRMTSSWPLAS